MKNVAPLKGTLLFELNVPQTGDTENTNKSAELEVIPWWSTVAETSILPLAVRLHQTCLFTVSPSLSYKSLCKQKATGLYGKLKHLPMVWHQRGCDKTPYLFLSWVSHLASFQQSPGQSGACFMCLIDTWARGLTQMLVSLCTSTIKQQDALCHIQKQTGELDVAAGRNWVLHAKSFWQEAMV